jgi:RNA polymerase subunit RPABC4/transcription elongation factor Spt4
MMRDEEICPECGQDMELVVVKEAQYKKNRRIARFKCDCGFQMGAESWSESVVRINQNMYDEARNMGVGCDYDGSYSVGDNYNKDLV